MYLRCKRGFDIFFATLALGVLFPLMILVSLLIKICDPGPIFFKQIRIGCAGFPFVFWKFRSMPVGVGDIPSDQLGVVKMHFIGRFIRRTNIDELPQLFNILCGDMSLVGPRPAIISQVELITLRRKGGVLSCRPGLTGLAQVSSFSGMTVNEKVKFDVIYAHSITFMGDLKIILKTFFYLLKPPPVY